MKFKRYNGTEIDLATKDDLDNKIFNSNIYIGKIEDLRNISGNVACGICFGKDVYLNGALIPMYSKGTFVCSGTDAVMTICDMNRNVYIIFRNGLDTYLVRKI